jgi:hypothetical protein
MIPKGQYERYSTDLPVRPLVAELFRSTGTWWLRYEDGHHTNTHYAAWGPSGFRKAYMVGVVTEGRKGGNENQA